jgi:serine/threonine-protein kinase
MAGTEPKIRSLRDRFRPRVLPAVAHAAVTASPLPIDTTSVAPPRDEPSSPSGPASQPASASAGDSLPPSSPPAGAIALGRYTILSPIKHGAMGTIHRARQEPLGREVAVKVLHPHLAQQRHLLASFFREARAGSLLNHPNVVQVLDFGRDDNGRCLMAMELLDARSLEEIVSEMPVPPVGWTLDVASQLLSALCAAHEIGIVHRDIKPANILIQTITDAHERLRPKVKVCDFGIARVPSQRARSVGAKRESTLEGLVCGTPEYMSPEQALAKHVDERADLYSTGVVLYELSTGRLPFSAESAVALTLEHAHGRFPLPSRIKPDIEPQLEAIIVRALEKDPAARYQSAREMRADVVALADELGTRKPSFRPPPPPPPPAGKALELSLPAPPALPGFATAPSSNPARGRSLSVAPWVWLGLSALALLVLGAFAL